LKKDLIIFTENFLIRSDIDKFKINILSKFFKIWVYDFTYYLNSRYYSKYLLYFKKYLIKFKNYQLIKKNKDITGLLNFLEESEEKKFILYHLSNDTKLLYFRQKLLKIKNLFYINFSRGLIPEPKNKNIVKILYYKLGYILAKIFSKSFFYDYSFISGTKDNILSKNVINGYSANYDSFLKNKFKKKNKQKFAVFLDEMMPDHPDYYKCKFKSPIKSRVYFNLMNNFFDWFEHEKKIKIKILLHPKNFAKKKLYNNRALIYGRTAAFVKNAQYVFLHCSTSVSYAILWKKPLIYLVDRSLTYMYPRVVEFYKNTGGTLVNLSSNYKNNFKKSTFNNVDKTKYSKYIDNFVKHPQSKKDFFKFYLRKIINT
jgi:hypothetical protein